MFSLLLLFFILLCLSAFFSASETSLFSLSGVDLHKLKGQHGQTAKRLVESLREPRKILITILLGSELVNVCTSIVGAAMISRTFRTSGVESQTFIAVAIITPIILVFGDIAPKNIAIRYAAQIAPIAIWPLRAFYELVRPLRALLNRVADRVIVLLGGNPEHSEPMIMEDEFRRLVDLGRKEGVIVEEEHTLIHNVFEFTDKVVSDIMTPVDKIFSLASDMPFDKVVNEIRSVQFSRVPFYKGDKGNIIGVLHVRDLFPIHRMEAHDETATVEGILRPPLFIEKKSPLENLLKEFQRSQMHMAIVKDEGGNMAGIVTMDDVLEELFGEIE